MSWPRTFRKVGGIDINPKVSSVQFHKGGRSFSIRVDGGYYPGANWSLHQAEQLVESGNWEEFYLPDITAPPAVTETAPETTSEIVW